MTIVAIDGPAGAGKSTVARLVAKKLGFRYLDTGALYRAVTVAVLDAGVAPADESGAALVAAKARIELDEDRVWLDGRDVSARIREPDVTTAVSTIAGHAAVRAALVPLQRVVAAEGHVVIEGRDIAATIVPDADVKIFLTASPEERARRRSRDLGVDEGAVDRVRLSLQARDHADSTRAASPLVQVPDAVVVDSTHLDLGQVVDEIVRHARRATAATAGASDD